MKWYEDPDLLAELPPQYRAYAAYSALLGSGSSRRVPGGSFMLRVLRSASVLTASSTTARIRGIDGLTVVTDFADERILEVIHEIRGENPEYGVMKALLSEGAMFVDVGANFGTFSLLGSRLVGSSGKVVAIEPQARLAAMIEESLMLSQIHNCTVERVACGSVAGERTLLVPSDDSGRAGFFAGFSGRPGHAEQRVVVTTLDALMERHRGPEPALIKIDVEGSEIDVLMGAERTISWGHPSIMIEMNPWSASAAGHAPAEIIDRLMSLGYSSFATADSYPLTADPASLPLDRQTNIIAIK
jgi:FkbM family methyltransferase